MKRVALVRTVVCIVTLLGVAAGSYAGEEAKPKKEIINSGSVMGILKNRVSTNAPYCPEMGMSVQAANAAVGKVSSRLRYCLKMDRAWTVMLYKQELITKQQAAKILTALKDAEEVGRGFGGETLATALLDGDEDLASLTTLGRTLQEPMSRQQCRDLLLEIVDEMVEALDATLDSAEKNTDSVMAGCTHFAHGQASTYGAYLVAIHDSFYRGVEQLELAYKHTNMNSGGCGSVAGTGLPVDRNLITELLGLDRLVEPCYDCEPSQDYALTSLFALTNVMTTMSRFAIDHEIWSSDDVGIMTVEPQWMGTSSYMPQKAHPGTAFEWLRGPVNKVMGNMMTGLMSLKNESYQDVLPIYGGYQSLFNAGRHSVQCLYLYKKLVPAVIPKKEVMLRKAREGFCGATDLALVLIRQKGYGARRAHRITGTMIRFARERGVDATQATGALLDEAAESLGEPKPGLSTAEILEALDPVRSVMERHTNTGDPNPKEMKRMIEVRRAQLEELRARQTARRGRIQKSVDRLNAEIAAIVAPEE